MNEKQLIAQLKKLQAREPNAEWLKANRDVLRAQIYSGREETVTLSFWAKLNLAAHQLSQPYAVAIIIVLFFSASGVVGSWMSQDSKPGEALYMAKVATEKAKFSVAFNDEDRAKLNLEFAKERVNEMGAVMTQDVKPEAKQEKVAVLKDNFKKEITQAKERIAKVVPVTSKTPTSKVAKSNIKLATPKTSASGTPAINANNFYTAGRSKDNSNIDINTGAQDNKGSKSSNPVMILDEAEQLLEKNDLQGAKQALDKATQILDNKDTK